MIYKFSTNMNSWTLYFRINYLSFIVVFLLLSCAESVLHTQASLEEDQPKPKQGVAGHIVFRQGQFDQQGKLVGNGRVMAVQRELYIFEATSFQEAEISTGSFIKLIHTKLIDSIKSDKDGYFQLPLKPGMYSVFVKENEQYYSPLNDDGWFSPIIITKDSLTEMEFTIDYLAKYED